MGRRALCIKAAVTSRGARARGSWGRGLAPGAGPEEEAGSGNPSREGRGPGNPAPKVGAGGCGGADQWPCGRGAGPGYPLEGALAEVRLARARPSPRREVTAAGVCAARALGLLEAESVSSHACPAGAVAAVPRPGHSLLAVTVLRDSGQRFRAHICGLEGRPAKAKLPAPSRTPTTIGPRMVAPELILSPNPTHNFPNLFVVKSVTVFTTSPGIKNETTTRTKNKKRCIPVLNPSK